MNIPCNKMFVWSRCGESKDVANMSNIEITFDFVTPAGIRERICMIRKSDEQFEATRQRLMVKLANLSKPKIKKPKKNDSAPAALLFDQILLPISMIDSQGEAMPHESVTNFDIFRNARSVAIGKEIFEVVQDAPIIEKLSISVFPIVGCPVIPSCDWKPGCFPPQEVKFNWYIASTDQFPEIVREGAEIRVENCSLVYTGEIFSPVEQHAGMHLSLVISTLFAKQWLAKIVTCKTPIQSMPEDFIFTQRQVDYCSSRLSGTKYRLISYNILADLYLNLRLEQERLFFAYCPKKYQEPAYRYPIVMKELEGYNADLIFLQEVDYRIHYRFLHNFLKSCGFTSTFKVKEREVSEGLMIAFRSERFRMVEDSYSVRISDLLDETKYPENADIVEFLTSNENVYEIMSEKPNVLQVVYLETFGQVNRPILACNTHLAFDPKFENVKLLQALLCLRYISRIKRQLNLSYMLVLYCGDFNSTKDSAVARLMQGGAIEADDLVWCERGGFAIPEKYQYSSLAGFPEYTNYTRGFSGCLDYMWKDGTLICEKVVPMPDHQLVVKYEAIPSKIAPSDHLPIISDVDMKPPEL